MDYDALLAHFGGLTKAAKALKASKQTVHNWGARNAIPAPWQIRAANLSKGKLKPDRKAQRWAREIASFAGNGSG
jgi:hypothetical protein